MNLNRETAEKNMEFFKKVIETRFNSNPKESSKLFEHLGLDVIESATIIVDVMCRKVPLTKEMRDIVENQIFTNTMTILSDLFIKGKIILKKKEV